MGVYFYAGHVFGKLFAAWRPTLSSPFTNVFQSLSRDSVYSNAACQWLTQVLISFNPSVGIAFIQTRSYPSGDVG
jgi:hypothetical protein